MTGMAVHMMALTMHMVKTCDAYNKSGDVHDRTAGLLNDSSGI